MLVAAYVMGIELHTSCLESELSPFYPFFLDFSCAHPEKPIYSGVSIQFRRWEIEGLIGRWLLSV